MRFGILDSFAGKNSGKLFSAVTECSRTTGNFAKLGSNHFQYLVAGLMPIGVIKFLKQMQPLTVDIGNRLGVVGNYNIVLDPAGRATPFNHFVDLIIDAGPEFTTAFGVE